MTPAQLLSLVDTERCLTAPAATSGGSRAAPVEMGTIEDLMVLAQMASR
jgi:hypothetical protein